jgi:hypothetical protein
MKVFVGYGYNERDRWIEEIVLPMIRGIGLDLETGKEIYGQKLDDGVRGKICGCNYVLGFTTRRDELAAAGRWTTHQWVKDELLVANEHGIPFVEVRDDVIDAQEGLLGGHARLEFADGNREQLYEALAKLLMTWSRPTGMLTLELMPDDFTQQMRPLLRDPDLRCLYKVLDDAEVDPRDALPTKLLKTKRGFAMKIRDVPRNAMIQIEIWRHRTLLWTSDWESTDARVVHLSPELPPAPAAPPPGQG